MAQYGQFCPVSKAMEILGERWTLLILRELLLGATRYSDIQRCLARISPTVLSKRLASLEANGLLVRRNAAAGHPEYQLTEAGRALYPIVYQTAEWGMRYARHTIVEDDLDVGLLMVDIQRRIDPTKLPGGRTVLRFRFTDLNKYADWWIRVDNAAAEADVDLCTEDPGDDVDVYFTTTLRTLTEVWMGDLPLARAREDGRLQIVGPSAYTRNLKSWLRGYVLADVRPARP
jgi:DNA-binding HxlR family transcriptional regulator